MGNIIESFTWGFGKAISSLFHDPLDFLSGKSCSSACGTTWDILCYMENFCVANLLKLALLFPLFYTDNQSSLSSKTTTQTINHLCPPKLGSQKQKKQKKKKKKKKKKRRMRHYH
ncbi:hypothetical protein Ancab_037345 [Ancistrocladus abbreviatus]